MGWLHRMKSELPRLAVEYGHVRPSRIGYRSWKKQSVQTHLAANGGAHRDNFRVIHPAARAENALPANIRSATDLPDTVGWWGFSFRDVPTRRSGETFLATVRDCRVIQYIEDTPGHRFAGDYYVGLLGSDETSLELREIRFRRRHAAILRSRAYRREDMNKAVWISERVYHNHSHWLTAHLPKLILLKDEGMLDHLVLPSRSTSTIDDSLAMLGIDRRDCRTVDIDTVLCASELTIIGSDRFRPELLRSVQRTLSRPSPSPERRIYVSRQRAARRRLLNEHEIWPVLRRHGFEQVFLEDLPFSEQVALMGETAVLVAPHGAGLTNMMFCAPGTDIVEIADLSFPNPNFYAVAAASGHRYWLIPAVAEGAGHPLERDMRTNPAAVEQVVRQICADG